MGLDMFLHRKMYVKNHGNKDYQVVVTYKGQPTTIIAENIVTIEEEIGYWRKSNAIHKWFVDNVQDGKDDCGNYHVAKEDLQHLIDDCNQVIDDHSLAKDLLPTQSGCFFGSTEYNKEYFNDIKYTRDLCLKALKLLESDNNSSIYYSSSW